MMMHITTVMIEIEADRAWLSPARAGGNPPEVESHSRTSRLQVIALRPQKAVVGKSRHLPSHLRADGAAFFAGMIEDHGIDDAARIAVLTQAASCLDRIAGARQSIDKDGVIVETQYGTAKAHPAVAVEKAARDGFYAALRLLGIDMNAWGDVRKRPPWNDD
jgi:hypothetical protein